MNNNYRPQWAYFTPDGYRDEPFRYVETFQLTFNGQEQANFPVQLDDDADFVLRGILANAGQGGFGGANALEVRIRDGRGNYLMSDYCLVGGGLMLGDGSAPGPIEAELMFPAGGYLTFDFWPGWQGGTPLVPVTIELHGVKRFKVCQ